MIKLHKLSSGVRLILEPMDAVRSVSIGIWCHNGSVNEGSGQEGISHYIEHMLFKGTGRRSTFDIVNEIDRLGGQMNAFTSKETTCFYVKCLDEHFAASADVLVDMISDPRFDPDEMEKEKQVVIEEIRMNQDDPDDLAIDRLEAAVFAGTDMAHPVLGTEDTVRAITRDSLRRYYFDHYTRDELVISVAGSYDEAKVIAYFEGKFTSLRSERPAEVARAPWAGQPQSGRHIMTRSVEQSHLAMGIRTVAARDKCRYAVALLGNILGGGMSSRLFQNVRERKGLAYSVYAMAGFYERSGIFAIAAGVSRERTEEAIDAIHEELRRLQTGDITPDEFDSAREQMKSAYIFRQESVQSRMIANGRDFLALGHCLTQNDCLAKLDAVSRVEVQEAGRQLADPAAYSLAMVTGKSYAEGAKA